MITLERLDKALKRVNTDLARITAEPNFKDSKVYLDMMQLRKLIIDFRAQTVKLDKLFVAMGI
jgi:hypothetical protein